MNTGNWQVNPAVYPDGLRAVADAVHASGRKFLVWFEPERGWNGSDMVLEHPEYFYDFELGGNKILNLGNPEAEKWMYGMISGMMDEQGIDYYRQDFNTAPLGAWRRNDKPGRTGISEIRHIEALYRIWDRLIGRYPDILIDNCASGGRRLDFEMMHRSVPLWASDFQCHQFFDSETAQSLVAGINAWLPCFGFGTQYRPGDTYNFRSLLGPGMAFELFMYENSPVSDDYPYDWHRKMLAEYRRAREFLSGDYYELTAQTRDKCQWHVLQFDRPDRNGGCIIAMRRSNSPFKVSEFVLRGIDPNASYVFEDADKETSQTLSGTELMENGLEIELPERRSSALLFYHKKQA
jgi:alpha-galactosidase